MRHFIYHGNWQGPIGRHLTTRRSKFLHGVIKSCMALINCPIETGFSIISPSSRIASPGVRAIRSKENGLKAARIRTHEGRGGVDGGSGAKENDIIKKPALPS
jgi:hypothetical protein